jgi:hypothetical protein
MATPGPIFLAGTEWESFMSPQMGESRAYQLLRADPRLWDNLAVRIQFLKDWVNTPVKAAADDR